MVRVSLGQSVVENIPRPLVATERLICFTTESRFNLHHRFAK
jgi:hypothetical protein